MPNIQLQFRRDTAANWTLNNPVLASGEMGIEMDTQLFKIGTGLTGWRGLTYGGLKGTGSTGITGNGISFMTINNAGVLSVSYTNGVNTVIGNVMGPPGISFSGPTGSIPYSTGSATTGTSGLSYGGGALLTSGSNFLDLNRFGSVVLGSTGTVTVGNGLKSFATINDQYGNIQLSTSQTTGNIRFNPGSAVVIGDNLYSQTPGNSVLKVDMITSLSGASGTTGQLLGVTGGTIAWVPGVLDSNNNVTVGTGGLPSAPSNSVSVGYQAGSVTQKTLTVAVGHNAGQINQATSCVAIGPSAGNTGQQTQSIAIGNSSGQRDQGSYAVAIGRYAGNTSQGIHAIAIGNEAGGVDQGTYSIAIGARAAGLLGATAQAANSIILNASGLTTSGISGQTGSFYVRPIRNSSGTNTLQYNPSTYEITYGGAGGVGPLGSIEYSDGLGGLSGSTGFAFYNAYTYAPGVTFNNFLTGGPNRNGIAFDDGQGNMLLETGGVFGNISVQPSQALQIVTPTLQVQVNSLTGTTGQFLGSDGAGHVTWLTVGGGYGNVLRVDSIKGVDATASPGGLPYSTVAAAVSAATAGQLIWVMPGTYNVLTGITLADGVSIRGASVQNTTIVLYNPGVDSDLLTLTGNNLVEDLTLRLFDSSHVNLRGIVLRGDSAYTSKICNSVITVENPGANALGTSDVIGVEAVGTQNTAKDKFSKNCLKGSTITVLSNGGGRKRGILVSGSSTVTARDMNIYVAIPADVGADSTGSYVGVETNDSTNNVGSIQLRSTSIQGSDPSKLNYTVNFTGSDILQTRPSGITNPIYLVSPGIQLGPGVDLLQKSAGSLGFSTWAYSSTIYYGLKGNLSSASPGYLWPGTQAVTNNVFPDSALLTPAYYRCEQPCIISGLSIGLNTAPTSLLRVSIWYSKAATPGTLVATPFSIEITAAATGSYYGTSVSLNTGDRIHVLAQYVKNTTTANDLTVQVDLF